MTRQNISGFQQAMAKARMNCRRWVSLAGLGLLLAVAPGVASAVTYTSVDGNFSYTVPPGVTQLSVTISGGGGGSGGNDTNGTGGFGGAGYWIRETALNVTPGQVITGLAGGAGVAGGTGAGMYGGAGGVGSGSGGGGGRTGFVGSSGGGGGGGGASWLALDGNVILKAGGGGGGQGASWNTNGIGGLSASTLVQTASCAASTDGGQGADLIGTSSASQNTNDGASGGGGGGGFTAGGGGGGAHFDNSSGGWAAGAGNSCISTAPGLFSASGTVGTGSGSNTSGFVTISAAVELAIIKSDGVSSLLWGSQTTYLIRVTNNGPYPVTGSVFADPQVSALPKVSITCSSTPGQCVTPPTIAELESGTFALPMLAVGQFYEIAVTASAQSTGTAANSAWVKPPSAFTSTGSSCTNSGLPAGVTRSFNSSTYTCTVTDTDSVDGARITLVKNTTPVGFNQNFTITPTNFTDNSVATLNAGTSTTVTRVLSSTATATTLNEGAVVGWRGRGISCVATTGNNGETLGRTAFTNSTVGTVSAGYNNTVPANTFITGNEYTCTITNETARLRYQKTTLPANTNQNFTIAAFNGVAATTINATTGASAYALVTTPGATANLTENGVVGWTALNMSCVADTGNNSVTQGAMVVSNNVAGTAGTNYSTSVPGSTLVPGNDYTCSWTNGMTRVTLAKNTLPAAFNQNFSVTPTNFTDNSVETINAGTATTVTRIVSNPAAATTLNEAAVTGWRGHGISCVATTGNNGQTLGATVFTNSTTGSVGFAYNSTVPANTFIAGNDYTCTITNETARLRYQKVTTPANINQNFTIAPFNGVLTNTINATTGATAYQLVTTPQTTANLTENGVTGWTALNMACVADTGNNSVTQGAMVVSNNVAGTAGTNYSTSVTGNTLVPGNDYTCSWTNRATRITLAKSTSPVSGINQNFSVTPTNFTDNSAALINDGTSTTVTRVLSSTASATTLNEGAITGWRGRSMSCVATTGNNGQTQGATVFTNNTVGTINTAYNNTVPANTFIAGNDYTCTVTNDGALLRLAKMTAPVNGINQTFTNNTNSNGLFSFSINFNAATGPSFYVAINSVAAATQPGEAAVANWRGTGMICRRDSDGVAVFTAVNAGTVGAAYTPTAIPANTFALGSSYTCTLSNEIQKPVLTKAFAPSTIQVGATTTLTLTISSASGVAAQTGLSFTDTLPSGLVLASVPTAAQCGGTVSGAAGSSTISLSGGSLAAGPSSCTINVSVTTASGQSAASCPNASTTNGASNITAIASNLVNGVSNQCVNVLGPPTLTISKISQNGTGTFIFNGSGSNANGFPIDNSYSITTATAGVAATGSQDTLAATNVITDIQEILPSGWTLTSASCTDANASISGNPSGTISPQIMNGNTIRIAAANVKLGADLQCVVTNTAGGATLIGKVILDNGAGGGTAHDAAQNGAETGRSGVTVSLTNCGTTTYASAVTDANGGFSFGLASVPAGNVCLVKTPTVDYVPVSANTGTTGGTYTRASDRLSFTLASGTSYSGIVLGEVMQSRLTTDGQQQVPAGSIVVYSHTYVAGTSASVTFSTSDAASGGTWSSQLYRDANCDGQLGAGDTLLLAPVAVTAGQTVCLLDRVTSPAGATNGARDVTTVTATEALTPTPNTGALTFTYTRTDTTTVGQAGVTLVKMVRKLSVCPSSAAASLANGTPYTTSNAAKAGEALEYRITYSNNTSLPVTQTHIHDAVPTYTLFQGAWCLSTPTSGITGCTVQTQPAVNASSGTIDWRLDDAAAPPIGLQPGAQGSVSFCVKVQM